ncbi:tetratricopeptide repeat protein [Magnetovibrio sp.]|uniref:tetratricopeptide repeat protein n=1 Tax=Magnetovibrio sp. TaxID=2024836 RepID=UPI002F95E8B8
MNRTSLRIAAVVLSLTAVSGCSALQDSELFQPEFWAMDRSDDNVSAELGLAELAKGNNVLAQAHFERALKANPNDVQALFGLATLYQNSGQPTRARQLYEAILALNPRPTDELLVWAGKQTQPIVDLASVNIHLLESGVNAPIPGGMSGDMNAQPSMSPTAPMTAMAAPQPAYGAMQPQQMARPMAMNASEPIFKDADLNIVARFKTLRALLDQGLITQDEFLMRRKVNVGALLPMTSPPAATGLDRPVPAVEQVSARLNAIGRALEMRALSPAQHTAERSMILDALMPARPSSVANPAPPPKGLMEAADAVRRLEMLNAADLITSDEYAKERAAIEASMQPPAPQMPAGDGAMAKQKSGEAKPALSGFQPAVHLASYRQQKAAERGWAELSKRFGDVLGGLEYRIERVDLGNSKGVFYRLKAGPLPSNNAAKDACRTLKVKRQYCEPTTINFG